MGAIAVTRRAAFQGIYCAACASVAAFQASAISAVAGWWGFPWGPVYTLGNIWANAFGGFEPPGSRERLFWRNALSFASRGNAELSYAIARNLRTSRDEQLALKAARLMDLLKANGVDTAAAHLKPAWRKSPLEIALHLFLALALPAVAALIAYPLVQK